MPIGIWFKLVFGISGGWVPHPHPPDIAVFQAAPEGLGLKLRHKGHWGRRGKNIVAFAVCIHAGRGRDLRPAETAAPWVAALAHR